MKVQGNLDMKSNTEAEYEAIVVGAGVAGI